MLLFKSVSVKENLSAPTKKWFYFNLNDTEKEGIAGKTETDFNTVLAGGGFSPEEFK